MRLSPLAILLCLACASAPAGERVIAQATIRDANGAAVGTARIVDTSSGPLIRVQVSGLPAGTHGIHIHAVGQCDAATTPVFSSAGGHFNPTGREHGRNNPAGPHVGDLPNITLSSGGGSVNVPLDAAYIDSGPNTLFDDDGSAIVVHQNTDDQRTNEGAAGPGGSGPRIACGVLTRSAPTQ